MKNEIKKALEPMKLTDFVQWDFYSPEEQKEVLRTIDLLKSKNPKDLELAVLIGVNALGLEPCFFLQYFMNFNDNNALVNEGVLKWKEFEAEIGDYQVIIKESNYNGYVKAVCEDALGKASDFEVRAFVYNDNVELRSSVVLFYEEQLVYTLAGMIKFVLESIIELNELKK